MLNAAEERARLANMALAEVGLPALVRPTSTLERPRWVKYPRNDALRPVVRRAIHLADLRLVGPDHMLTCKRHTTLHEAFNVCRKVTVAEALLGHDCGAD